MSGEGQSYLLPLSGLDQMINIDKWSNTNVPGLWIFKVGPLAPLENVIEPDTGVSQGLLDLHDICHSLYVPHPSRSYICI